jgi:hypothetical protein
MRDVDVSKGKDTARLITDLNLSPSLPGGVAPVPLIGSAMHNFWFALASNKIFFR